MWPDLKSKVCTAGSTTSHLLTTLWNSSGWYASHRLDDHSNSLAHAS
jgi:hypothetical protein